MGLKRWNDDNLQNIPNLFGMLLYCLVLHFYVFSCHQTTLWPLQGTFLQFHHPYVCCLHFVLNTVCSKYGISMECTEKSKLFPPLKSFGIKTDYIFGLR